MPKKKRLPLDTAKFQPWLERVIGQPLHKRDQPQPMKKARGT